MTEHLRTRYLFIEMLKSNLFTRHFNGTWPSGKAPGFGPGIRGFESLLPSQISFNYSNQTSTLSGGGFWVRAYRTTKLLRSWFKQCTI